MNGSGWAAILSAGAIGAVATLLGALVTQWGQARRDRVAYRRALADARRVRLRQEYTAALSALEACQQLLNRANLMPVSPEGAARLSGQISAALAALNQAIAAVRLNPEVPNVDALYGTVGFALGEMANSLDRGTFGQSEGAPALFILSTADTDGMRQAIDQLVSVMREQLARLERS